MGKSKSQSHLHYRMPPNAQELMVSITTGSSGERGWGEMKDNWPSTTPVPSAEGRRVSQEWEMPGC